MTLLLLASRSPAQDGMPEPPRPGWVLVDDMWLPPEALLGDGFYHGTLWSAGVVPYALDASLSAVQQSAVQTAMEYLEAVCGVDFVPRTVEPNFILVRQYAAMGSAGQCPVGMVGGVQELAVGPFFTGSTVFMHELLHGLGFQHEHQRSDRDSFITVNWGNVASICGSTGDQPCTGNFPIIPGGTLHGTYDFLSVMHYRRNTFANPGTDTITCNAPFVAMQNVMGTLRSMSYGDAAGLIAHYGSTHVHPLLSGVCPAIVPQNAGDRTISIFGSNFYQGSLDGTGVPGTLVLVNGIAVSTLSVTFVDSHRLDAVIPGFWFANQGTLQISVENPYGGASPAVPLQVGPQVSFIGNWNGSGVGSQMGKAVAGIGDVNDDGFDDVVVGSPGDFYNGQQYGGRVTCYSGSDGATIWSVLGVAPRGHGTALANAGDVDGDGISDVLEGAPATYGSSPYIGYAILRSGDTGGIIRTYSTGVINDGFGTSVANAGDIDLDGVPDQIVGIPLAHMVKVYSGATGGLIRTHTIGVGSYFGGAVAGGSDFNLDGVPDYAVGAPWFGGDFRGRFHIFSGSTGSQLSVTTGLVANDYYGQTLAMGPSPDGRAGGALYAGIPGYNSDTGQVRIYGANATTPYPLVATRNGLSQHDKFGWSVNPVGDIDQDGLVEMAVGAPQDASGPGYVRIFASTGATLAHVAGTENGGAFGWAVAPAGDFDRDGVPDVIVGAVNTGLSCINNGSAHILEEVRPPARKKVMITEVYWGEPQGLEVTNFADFPVSLGGMRVIWDDGTRYVSSPFPSSITIAAGESIIVRETCGPFGQGCGPVGSFYPEAPPSTRSFSLLPTLSTQSQALRVGLLTTGGVVLDEVRIRAVAGATSSLAGVGGHFRGVAPRQSSSICAERIWGLDSNSGGDWTSETVRSFGLENRSSGQRGSDPIQLEEVVVNELLDRQSAFQQNYVELKNVSLAPVNLRNWFILWSPGQGMPHQLITPWSNDDLNLGANAFTVIGDVQSQPAELPPGVTYVHATVGGQGLPFPVNAEEFEIALYDDHGRVVDLARGTGNDDVRVHNHKRAPSAAFDFAGAVPRSLDSGSGGTGRDAASTDTNAGSDWRPIYTRTMGSANLPSTWGGPPGLGDKLDVRLNATGLGGGFTCIINAGPQAAGKRWSFFFNAGHLDGQGPFFGLGSEALPNWLMLGNTPPWFGFLDSRGSARLDLPPATFPSGLQTDGMFILQDAAGGLVRRTTVIEWDT